MGRAVKRVDPKFNWPLDKTWGGYVLASVPCPMMRERGKPCTNKCPVCYGDQAVKPMIEPPSGDAWQMWETVSEGSPISPPCATPEELARWLADNNASSCGRMGATYEQWLKMIGVGWAPCFSIDSKGIRSGVEYMGDQK